jgi:hypothetical protein
LEKITSDVSPAIQYLIGEELLQFVNQWSLIRNVKLNPHLMDEIRWKWTSNGECTTASAYKIQFQGSHAPFQVGRLWKASVEPKVKVFSLTAMHQKILTADNLASRGMQHNPLCPLCNAFPEDARHLLINCEFAKEVLRLMWNWCHFQGSPSTCPNGQDPASWIAANAARADPANARRATGSLLYCWWNLWKERNKRIFDSKHRSEFQVAFAAKEEFELYLLA